MERYCGYLKANLKSKSRPWANLNKRILHTTYLKQLGFRYNLQDELSTGPARGELSQYERVYEDCMYKSINLVLHDLICALADPQSILRPKYDANFIAPDSVRFKIARYLALVVKKNSKEIKALLPEIMPRWSRVRIAGHGDSIRSCLNTGHLNDSSLRDSSYVQVRCNLFPYFK